MTDKQIRLDESDVQRGGAGQGPKTSKPKITPKGQGPTIVISEPYETIVPEELAPRLMQISAATVVKSVPDAYRLARFEDGNGAMNLKLQGYFTWFQGGISGKYCGEWRDIETVDWLHARDDEPYGSLRGMH
jgi:hypothetical protein